MIMSGDTPPNSAVYAGSATVPVPPVADAFVDPVDSVGPVGPGGVPVDAEVDATVLVVDGVTPLIYESVRKSIGIHFTLKNK